MILGIALWRAMVCGLDPFLDRSLIPLCFRYVVLSVCEIHIHVQVILNLFHHTTKFSIAVYYSYHESGSIIVPENIIECTIVLIVLLLGIHWDQASELNCSINCS
jgi:hypothetical protein